MKFAISGRPLLFFVLAIVGASFDILSKNWMFSAIGFPYRTSDWEWQSPAKVVILRFHTTLNEGALWGLGHGWTSLFALFSLMAVVAIIYWLFWRGAAKSLWMTVTLGLVTAGTLGNLYDRVGLHGLIRPETGKVWYGVRDFIAARLFDVYEWPVFNLADVFLVAGAIMLGLFTLIAEDPAAVQKHDSKGLGDTEALLS